MKKENKYSLDELLTNELRFFIMTILAMYEEVDFNFLKEELNATDGNLSVQLRKLEEYEYIEVEKQFINRKPKSTYRITKKGLIALKEHLNYMEEIKKKIEE
ncbi:MAG: transcriptional regulator [Verrucomicrobiae bacterium]|nr:transcriptional regulator [Verrucomicrobiae bacterium]